VIKGFKDFVLRGNVVDLAVAVVVGAAFGSVVTALMQRLLQPLLNSVTPASSPGFGVEEGPAEPTDVELLIEIRDLLRAQQQRTG
jgi:large conductance mechanosensitive channel